MSASNPLLLRTTEACERAAIGTTKLEELIKDGLIEVVWIGGARRIVADSLDAYIKSLCQPPAAEVQAGNSAGDEVALRTCP